MPSSRVEKIPNGAGKGDSKTRGIFGRPGNLLAEKEGWVFGKHTRNVPELTGAPKQQPARGKLSGKAVASSIHCSSNNTSQSRAERREGAGGFQGLDGCIVRRRHLDDQTHPEDEKGNSFR